MNKTDIIAMTKATGFGNLPELLETKEGHKALCRIFEAEGVPLEIFENRETRIPVCAMRGVFERASRATGQRTFGVEVGKDFRYKKFGLWMEYSASAPTLLQALQRTVRTAKYQQTGGRLLLVNQGEYSVWRYFPPLGQAHTMQHSDHLLGPMIGFVSAFLGRSNPPVWLELDYPRDDRAFEVENMFESPIRFGTGAVGVAMRTSDLACRASSAARQKFSRPVTLFDVAACEPVPVCRPGTVHSISSIIALRLLAGKTDIEGAAQVADLGVQTLQRRLRAEGTSYRTVLERVRHCKAQALLNETDLPVIEIGLNLGYSEHANFSRAFQRWSGCAPAEFRAAL